ncbi:4935_t:CDS:2, partial [Acaulospora colombiana]
RKTPRDCRKGLRLTSNSSADMNFGHELPEASVVLTGEMMSKVRVPELVLAVIRVTDVDRGDGTAIREQRFVLGKLLPVDTVHKCLGSVHVLPDFLLGALIIRTRIVLTSPLGHPYRHLEGVVKFVQVENARKAIKSTPQSVPHSAKKSLVQFLPDGGEEQSPDSSLDHLPKMTMYRAIGVVCGLFHPSPALFIEPQLASSTSTTNNRRRKQAWYSSSLTWLGYKKDAQKENCLNLAHINHFEVNVVV